MKNIVILGAGFGGLRTALKLEKKLRGLHADEWSIILIDRNSYHIYTPALYEAASAYKWSKALDARQFEEMVSGSVCLPIREILAKRNITFTRDEIAGLDVMKRAVKTKTSGEIPFEYLVLALGSETIYFGVEGAEKCCYALKTVRDAFCIRRRLEAIFDAARRQKEIRVVIVGGGTSGIEVIAEIATDTRHLAKEKGVDFNRVLLSVFEAKDQILPEAHASQRTAVEKRLKKLGVEVITGTTIKKVMPQCVVFGDEEKCEADMILWGGGNKGPTLFEGITDFPLTKKGQVEVDAYLRVKGAKESASLARAGIFAIGDNSFFKDVATGAGVPATAYVAETQADVTAENIVRAIKGESLVPYRLFTPGYVMSCGGKYAVARLFGFTFSGFLGWVVKKMIDLKYFASILPITQAVGLWIRELRLFVKND